MDKTSLFLSQVWDSVANNFDSVEPSIWKISGKNLVDKSHISSGNRVLDIGTGKGATLIPISQCIGDHGTVTGVDLSISMVNYTNKLINKLKLSNAKILHVNATNLNSPDNYFDNLVAGFSFRYFLQNHIIFKNLINKLKTGGTLSFTLWGRDIHDVDIEFIIARYINLVPSAVDELNPDNKPLITVSDIKNRLLYLGMHDINVTSIEQSIVYKCFEDIYKELWNSLYRVNFEKILSLGKNIYDKFYNDLSFYFERYRVKNGIELRWNVIYALCQK